MTTQPDTPLWFAEIFEDLTTTIGHALLGKSEVVRLALTCLFAEGHLLLEDAPGTGKTALARALAASVSASNSRIQFTPDLLPSDITGVTIWDQNKREWEFHKGPVFASVVLADEINRASPKTQSALLEVMEESHVTVDGTTHDAPFPFMVIATQNPIEQAGTYRLPEAQLDRFLMKTSIGYPNREATLEVLRGSAHPDRVRLLRPKLTADTLAAAVEATKNNHIDDAVLDYVFRVAEATRASEHTVLGVSTRGLIGMARAARVWAGAEGRDFVIADDVRSLAHPVWAHRLVMTPEAEFNGVVPEDVVDEALAVVPVPAGRGVG